MKANGEQKGPLIASQCRIDRCFQGSNACSRARSRFGTVEVRFTRESRAAQSEGDGSFSAASVLRTLAREGSTVASEAWSEDGEPFGLASDASNIDTEPFSSEFPSFDVFAIWCRVSPDS